MSSDQNLNPYSPPSSALDVQSAASHAGVEEARRYSFGQRLGAAIDPPADIPSRDLRLGGLALCAVTFPLYSAIQVFMMTRLNSFEKGQPLPALDSFLPLVMLIPFTLFCLGVHRGLWGQRRGNFALRMGKTITTAVVSLVAMAILSIPGMVTIMLLSTRHHP